jgi:hypothetical protein
MRSIFDLNGNTPDTRNRGHQSKSHGIPKMRLKSILYASCWMHGRAQYSDKQDWVPPWSVKLLDRVCERIRYLHCSLQTEKVYVYWAKAFVL